MSQNVLTKKNKCAIIQLATIRGRLEVETMSIGERLRQARGSTPRETVARTIGVSVSAITMYENGERIPRDPIKVKLAEFFNTTVQDLFFSQKCHD